MFETEDETIATAIKITTHAHLTFEPLTAESVFTQTLDHMPTGETRLNQVREQRNDWLVSSI